MDSVSFHNATLQDSSPDKNDWLWAHLARWKEEFKQECRNEFMEEMKKELNLYFQENNNCRHRTENSCTEFIACDDGAGGPKDHSLRLLANDEDSLLSFDGINVDTGNGKVEKKLNESDIPVHFNDIEEARSTNVPGKAQCLEFFPYGSPSQNEIILMREEIDILKQQIQDLSIGMASRSSLAPGNIQEIRSILSTSLVPRSVQERSPSSISLVPGNANGRTSRRLSLPFMRSLHPIRLPLDSNGQENNPNSTEGIPLDTDSFSLMMISKPFSPSWGLGLLAFALQAVLGIMIAVNQIHAGRESSILNIPFRVKGVVRVGQILTIILCLTTQCDVLVSIQTFLIMGKGSNWDEVVGVEGNRSRSLWMTRIMVPTTLKLIQGLIVILVCFVIILQSDDIITLLKDFTALMVLSDTDNIFFDLADYGYLGHHLQTETVKVRLAEIEIVEDKAGISTRSLRTVIKRGFTIRSVALCILFAPMLACWVLVVIKQEDGTFFKKKYPNCNAPHAFDLAVKHFGDGKCFGGPLNTLGCGFEGGDCVNFNLAYPLCKGDGLENVQEKIGDGYCDMQFNIDECNYDGYDCCSVKVINDLSFGNGQCNGGEMATRGCGYDGGDCVAFHQEYPECDLEELSNREGSSEVVLGDGVCTGGVYFSEACGWENGDCDRGQVGQDIALDKVYIANSLHYDFLKFFFDVKLSLDGSKLLIGFALSDFVNNITPGFVKAYTLDPKKRIWMSLGSDLIGAEDHELFGLSVAMNINGSRIAIGAPHSDDGKSAFYNSGHVKVFDFNATDSTWLQVGETITGEKRSELGANIDLSADGSRLAIAAPSHGMDRRGEISIWDFHSSSREWIPVGGKIIGRTAMEAIGGYTLQMSSSDGSRIIFNINEYNTANAATRVYAYNQNTQEWSQLGDIDIPNPYSSIGQSSSINANGSRIAVSAHAANPDALGRVQVFDFNPTNHTWDQVGETIFEPPSSFGGDTSSNIGNGFGRNVAMSLDGNRLAISMINPDCDGRIALCATGSVHLFAYDSVRHRFNVIPSKTSPIVRTGVIDARERNRESSIFGLHLSFNDDGSMLSISGYDLNHDKGFVNVYDVYELFYPDCVVYDPYEISNAMCWGIEPYVSEECGFDGGDCPAPVPVEDKPGCSVVAPSFLGDGHCIEFLPFNSEECEFDGGDCPIPTPVEGLPDCIVSFPGEIGNGFCNRNLPYNSKECNFDGGDCI